MENIFFVTPYYVSIRLESELTCLGGHFFSLPVVRKDKVYSRIKYVLLFLKYMRQQFCTKISYS